MAKTIPANTETVAHEERAHLPHKRFRWVSSAVVIVLLVAVNLFVQADRSYFNMQSDGHGGLQRIARCERLGSSLDVLYLGSSRTVYGLDPHVVDETVQHQFGKHISSCNAGLMGSSFEQDYFVLKRFISDGKAPKMVVETLWEDNLNVGIAPTQPTLDPHLSQILELANLSDISQLQPHFGQGLASLPQSINFAAQKMIPAYGDRHGIFKTLCGSSRIGPCTADLSEVDPTTLQVYSRSDDRGWVPNRGWSLARIPAAALDAKYLQLYPYHNEVGNFKIGGYQPAYLGMLIDLAQAHHIKIVMAATPLHPIYRKFYDHPTDPAEIAHYWSTVAQQHHIALFDETNAPGYVDADFVDPSHLDEAGAIKFSGWMASHAVGPALTHAPSTRGA